jgi:Helix-turn-helix domain
VMEDYERTGMIDSLQCQREEPTQYEGPGKRKLWALYGLNLMSLSSAAHVVGTVIIWHANFYSGRCDPSLGTLAYETGLHRRSVIRAIKELERKRVLRPQQRWQRGHQTSNAYHPNWIRLERTFRDFEKLVREHSATRVVTILSPRVVTESVGGSDKLVTLTNEGTLEGNTSPKTEHSDECPMLDDFLRGAFQECTSGEASGPFSPEPINSNGLQVSSNGNASPNPHVRDEIAIAFWKRREAINLADLKTEKEPTRREKLEAALSRARENLRRVQQ